MNPEIKMSESVSGTLQYVYLGYKTALLIKFINSGKATKFCEIFTLLLTVCTVVKSKVKISQNFVAFSEYMNFNNYNALLDI